MIFLTHYFESLIVLLKFQLIHQLLQPSITDLVSLSEDRQKMIYTAIIHVINIDVAIIDSAALCLTYKSSAMDHTKILKRYLDIGERLCYTLVDKQCCFNIYKTPMRRRQHRTGVLQMLQQRRVSTVIQRCVQNSIKHI